MPIISDERLSVKKPSSYIVEVASEYPRPPQDIDSYKATMFSHKKFFDWIFTYHGICMLIKRHRIRIINF